ncbi:aspartyl protease family protein [Croceiramulus getboli]|nr:aspartyl protease family protein [Flavobacteriaceae bacterium YJPT1-3]
MKTRLLGLVLLWSGLLTATAQDFSTYLKDVAHNELQGYEEGLTAFANADYPAAYRAWMNLSEQELEERPYLKELKALSVIYQRDPRLLQQVVAEQPDLLPPFYAFYAQQPQMELELEGSTSVALDKNLFQAVLNDRDTITIMLDTGGKGMGISYEWVEAYNMNRDTSLTRVGLLPAFQVEFDKHPALVPKVQIGSMTLTNIPASYTDPNSVRGEGEYEGPQFDAIMGLDVFVGFLKQVTFDWKEKQLRFAKKSTISEGQPFVFFSSKPFTSLAIDGQSYTTVLDTGSTTDILPKELYLNSYSEKESKTYGSYSFIEYTIPITLQGTALQELHIGDYVQDFNLVIGGESVPVLIGNKHQKMGFNLRENVVVIE